MADLALGYSPAAHLERLYSYIGASKSEQYLSNSSYTIDCCQSNPPTLEFHWESISLGLTALAVQLAFQYHQLVLSNVIGKYEIIIPLIFNKPEHEQSLNRWWQSVVANRRLSSIST